MAPDCTIGTMGFYVGELAYSHGYSPVAGLPRIWKLLKIILIPTLWKLSMQNFSFLNLTIALHDVAWWLMSQSAVVKIM